MTHRGQLFVLRSSRASLRSACGRRWAGSRSAWRPRPGPSA